MPASEHQFEFTASVIARAAEAEADYHEAREGYWSLEYDEAVARVEATCYAKVARRSVSGGYVADVVVDYGDPVAFSRMQEAFRKMEGHRDSAAQFRIDAQVYGTQGERLYELATADLMHYRIGAPARVLD